MNVDLFNEERRNRGIKMVIIFAMLVFLAFLASMNTGTFNMNPIDVLKTLVGNGTDKQNLVLFELRLPRMVIAILVGAGLAISGAILQGISRNGLSDPGILGINAGAGLAVILFISMYPHQNMAPPFVMPFLAFVGAGVTALIIYVLSYKKNHGVSPTRLLLVGIAVAAGISAITIILTLKLDPRNLEFVAMWQMGDLYGKNWSFVLTLLPWIAIIVPFVIWKSNVLNVLTLHEHIAGGLGLSIERERIYLLIAAVALAAACVATGGGIGFIGLLGPHIARRLVGPKHQFMLPVTAMVGSLIVLVADTIARSIMENTELPVGVVVSLLGAPYFLYLLIKSSKTHI